MPQLQQLFQPLGIELIRVLAEGGMGIVYEAHQLGVGDFRKKVAVKVIRDRYSAIEDFRRNFMGEACLVAGMSQANIVHIHQLGEVGGRLFMVMEFVDGYTLESFILQHRAMGIQIPVDLAGFILSRVCRGLSYVHNCKDSEGRLLNVVHRDVNPRNILISREGEVKLGDFGIAKARSWMYCDEGKVIAGKSEYLSPEQARREVTDARADLFSCGVVLSEMICGDNIFEADTSAATRRNILNLPLPDFSHYRPGLDVRMQSVLRRALARRRDDRFQSALEFLVALEQCIYGDGYGPTSVKLADYLGDLFASGLAYIDDTVSRSPSLSHARLS